MGRQHLAGNVRIASEGVVIAGRWWHPQQSAAFKTA